jgi:apolipoprotein D and lipocalin family protein
MMSRHFAVALLTVGASQLALARQPTAPLRVVPEVDLRRYAGTWYEIARLPNKFQRACVSDVTATYALQPDNRIAVTNRCRESDGDIREARGVARRVEGRPPSVLKVRFAPAVLSFLPMVWGDYNIIDLGADYDYAVVGTPDRSYLWILARRPEMDPPLYQRVLDGVRAQGFDVSALVATAHGRPGELLAPGRGSAAGELPQ